MLKGRWEASITSSVTVDTVTRADGRTVRYYRTSETLSVKPEVSVVTGVDGYVGRAVAQALLRAGQAVVGLAAQLTPAVTPLMTYLGSAGFAPAWEAIASAHRVRAIYHCARLPEPPVPDGDVAAYYHVHVTETLAMLSRWTRATMPPLLLLSSTAVSASPPATASAWIQSLQAEENLVASLCHRWVALRVAEVVGPDDLGRVADGPDRPWARLAEGGATTTSIRDVVPMRDYVSLADVADAFVRAGRFLAAGGASQALNVGSGHNTPLEAVAEAFGQRTADVAVRWDRAAHAPQAARQWDWRPHAINLEEMAEASVHAVRQMAGTGGGGS